MTTSAPLSRETGSAAAERLEQIRRPFIAQRARISHRADDDDGSRIAHREMEEVGGFLERVGAAGHDDAGKLGVATVELVDAPRQLQPLLKGDRAAGGVGELLELGLHVVGEGRDHFDELFGSEAPAGGVRDRSAGCHQSHPGRHRRLRPNDAGRRDGHDQAKQDSDPQRAMHGQLLFPQELDRGSFSTLPTAAS